MNLPDPAGRQTLCDDVPIGRVIQRRPAPGGMTLLVEEYLSVDVSFHPRHTAFFHGTVESADHRFRLRGPVLELLIEVHVRPLAPWAEVARYVNGLHQLGDADGPWPLVRFQPAPGVLIGTVLRLGELSQMYNQNLRFALVSFDKPARAVFIPREHERELREIAARLRANAAGNA